MRNFNEDEEIELEFSSNSVDDKKSALKDFMKQLSKKKYGKASVDEKPLGSIEIAYKGMIGSDLDTDDEESVIG